MIRKSLWATNCLHWQIQKIGQLFIVRVYFFLFFTAWNFFIDCNIFLLLLKIGDEYPQKRPISGFCNLSCIVQWSCFWKLKNSFRFANLNASFFVSMSSWFSLRIAYETVLSNYFVSKFDGFISARKTMNSTLYLLKLKAITR